MSWGNSASKWGRKRTSERGEVVWTDKSGGKPAPFAQQMPRYEETSEIPVEYQEHLYVGALWSAQGAMLPDERSVGTKCPVLKQCWWQPENAPVKAKSLMIYAGIIRLEERESNGRIVSVPRHTFIAGDGRYVILDFNLVKPVI